MGNQFESILLRIKELNQNLVVRKAEKEDVVKFVNLFNENYNRKTNSDYYFWQFFDSPTVTKLFMVFDHESLIAYHGVRILKIQNSAYENIAFTVDLLIHSDYRRLGIMYLLEEQIRSFCIASNISFVCALPNKFGNSAFLGVGWKSLSRVNNLVLKDLDLLLNINTLEINNTLQNSFISFDKETKEYLHWRFDKNPMYKYIQIASDDNRSFAYVKVFIDIANDLKYGDIVYINSDALSISDIINKIHSYFKLVGINILTTWALPHTYLFKLFSELGFEQKKEERFFCIKDLRNIDNEDLLDINKWSLFQCDSEVY